MRDLLARLDRRLVLVLVVALGSAGLLPVFASNILRSADQGFFENWDRESQALVLARIEQARAGAAPSWGLSQARPDLFAPYTTFDAGAAAEPGSTFEPYTSQLGVQGLAFTALDRVGCSTVGCLTTVESLLFACVLVVFLMVLCSVTTRSFAIVTLAVCVLSPWVVASAHNLYWVPWTWLLPAVAAGVFTLARSRVRRAVALAAVVLSVALKCACGFEFITSVALLVIGMPILAAMFGHRPIRPAIRDAVLVCAAIVVAFLAILAALAIETGRGSLVVGLAAIADDAARRTYGAAGPGLDATTQASLRASPAAVLGMYVFGWQTDLLGIGVGTRFASSVGRDGLLLVSGAAVAVTVLIAVLRRPRWRRNLALLVVTLLAPVSWYVLAKSHAYTAVAMCYVLWYLIYVPTACWVIGDGLGRVLRPRPRERRDRNAGLDRDGAAGSAPPPFGGAPGYGALRAATVD